MQYRYGFYLYTLPLKICTTEYLVVLIFFLLFLVQLTNEIHTFVKTISTQF